MRTDREGTYWNRKHAGIGFAIGFTAGLMIDGIGMGIGGALGLLIGGLSGRQKDRETEEGVDPSHDGGN